MRYRRARSFAWRPSAWPLSAVWLAGLLMLSASLSASPPPAGVGDQLPAFKVVDDRGVPHTGAAFHGQPMLLDFWASWCFPCRFTLPELDRLHDEFSDRGLLVVGLSLDEGRGQRRQAQKMAEPLGYRTFFDTASKPLGPQLGVESLPTLFLIDADGRILRRWDGEPDFDDVRGAVIDLLGDSEASSDPVQRR